MKLSNLFDYSSDFYSDLEIKNIIKKSNKYENENIDDAKLLNFFVTSKQRTYLVITEKNIYCVLDNSKKEPLYLNWAQETSDFFDPNNVKGKVSTIECSPPKKNTGLVHFGFHSNWYYTKYLFEKKTIEQTLRDLITEVVSKKHNN